MLSSHGYASFSFERVSAPLSALHYLGASKGFGLDLGVDLGIEMERPLFPRVRGLWLLDFLQVGLSSRT